MQGVGNDFVVLDAAALPPSLSLTELAIRLCERHLGIGADGLLVISRDVPGAAFQMRMFNPDGTEDMCGNGLRCASLWAFRAGWLNGAKEFVIAVKEGVRAVRMQEVADSGQSAIFGVDMGVPLFEPEALPFCAPAGQRIIQYPLTVGQEAYAITTINTGSTHTVIFGDAPTEEIFQRVSPLIENHPLFPERTTILWATRQSDNGFSVRIWERGAGETLGCGTGACAVGVAAVVNGLCAPGRPTDIVSRGGILRITWPGENQSVDMIGPAHFVFEGEFAC